jgi:hypothetical protein
MMNNSNPFMLFYQEYSSLTILNSRGKFSMGAHSKKKIDVTLVQRVG